MPERIVLAFDLGGSGLRAALVGDTGAMLASYMLAMPVTTDAAGVSEADPDSWWQGLALCAEALAAVRPDIFGKVQAVAIAAFTRSQVFVGRAGQALRPALLWGDTRAAASLPALRALCPPGHPESAALNAWHPLARLWWLKQAEPENWRAVACVSTRSDSIRPGVE